MAKRTISQSEHAGEVVVVLVVDTNETELTIP